MNTATVLNDSLAWDLSAKYDPTEYLDLDPISLYNECPEVEEPKVAVQ